MFLPITTHAKTRTLQCDERRPVCNRCARRKGVCRYGRAEPEDSATRIPRKEARKPDAAKDLLGPDQLLGENQGRRLREIEMLHFYMTRTGSQTSFDTEGSMFDFWSLEIPRMAQASEALLYALFSAVCFHRAFLAKKADPDLKSHSYSTSTITSLHHEHRAYLHLTLQHHAEELTCLSAANADSIMATANLLRLLAFGLLSERELVSYTPPSEWLQMVASQGKVSKAALDLLRENKNSQTAFLFKSVPSSSHEMQPSSIASLLLSSTCGLDDEEQGDSPALWDVATREAYETTITYIEQISRSMIAGDPIGVVGRRLVLFPLLVRSSFVGLMVQSRRRALAILVYYFRLLHCLRSFWFVGDCGQREADAIVFHLQSCDLVEEIQGYTSRICEDYVNSVGLRKQ